MPQEQTDGIDVFEPFNGAIEVRCVKMRYRQGPLVLKGVSFAIEGGSNVGLVGRSATGDWAPSEPIVSSLDDLDSKRDSQPFS